MIVHFERKKKYSKQTESYDITCKPLENCHYDTNIFFSTQGTGMYVHIETSYPQQPGDTARLESPWMRGPQCMTFYYHMYGSTMSCLAIYIRHQATNRLKPVWVKSQDQGDRWIQGQISINETESYQVSLYNISVGRLIKKIREKANNVSCSQSRVIEQSKHFSVIISCKVQYRWLAL